MVCVEMATLLVFIMCAQLLTGLVALGVAIANRGLFNKYRLIAAIFAGVGIYTIASMLTPFWHRGWPVIQTILTATMMIATVAVSRGWRSVAMAGSILALGCVSFYLAWSLIRVNHTEWPRGQQMYDAAVCNNIRSEAETLIKKAPPSLRNRSSRAGRIPAPLLDWMSHESETFAKGKLQVNMPVRAWYTCVTGIYALRPVGLKIYYARGKPSERPVISVKAAERGEAKGGRD